MDSQAVSSLAAARRDPSAKIGRSAQELILRRLGPEHLPAIAAHLLALSDGDRHRRFHDLLDDEAIAAYVGRVDFARMILVGAFDAGDRLVALAEAHLDSAEAPVSAEVSVSVLPDHRSQGLGRLLTAVALDAAAARGSRQAEFHFQPGNRAVGRLVQELGRPTAAAPGYAVLALPLNNRAADRAEAA